MVAVGKRNGEGDAPIVDVGGEIILQQELTAKAAENGNLRGAFYKNTTAHEKQLTNGKGRGQGCVEKAVGGFYPQGDAPLFDNSGKQFAMALLRDDGQGLVDGCKAVRKQRKPRRQPIDIHTAGGRKGDALVQEEGERNGAFRFKADGEIVRKGDFRKAFEVVGFSKIGAADIQRGRLGR